MQDLIPYLSGGADAATYVILYFLWRVDKRVSHLEIITGVVS